VVVGDFVLMVHDVLEVSLLRLGVISAQVPSNVDCLPGVDFALKMKINKVESRSWQKNIED
jgi:hypothetical protein